MGTLSDLQPYNKILNAAQARHLLRRTTFVNSYSSFNKIANKNANEAVDLILSNGITNSKPTAPKWVNDSFLNWWKKPAAERQAALSEIYKVLYDQNYEYKRAWMEEMSKDDLSIREKMTLFWHGHFATKFNVDQVMPAQSMYRQIDLFRTMHQGNFKELTKKVCLDGAMIIFLNTNDSTKTSPNENFSRELLELYTTGLGQYTEEDVKEGAKVFTGIRTNFYSDEWTQHGTFKTFVWTDKHDFGDKNYLGAKITGANYKTSDEVLNGEVSDLVNIIFDKKKQAVAEFICEKIFKYFVYSNEKKVNKAVIATMANTFIANDFEIKPVLAQLFKSEYFYTSAVQGVQIKTPAETIVGLTKHFNVDGGWKEWVMTTMGLELMNPPNVAGWPGYRKWADTRTFPFAIQNMGWFIWNQKDEQVLEWIKQFPNYEDPIKLVTEISNLFWIKTSTSRVNNLKDTLLEGAPDYEWVNIIQKASSAGYRIKNLLNKVIKSPDFHLN